MAPTPKYNLKEYIDVYEPAEDSFLLLDTLEEEDWIVINPTIVLEVGSGSGVVSAFVASLIGPSASLYLCTDVNADAALATKLTANLNNVILDPIQCDFASALRSNIKVDVLLFNPPYVVTPPEEVGSYSIKASWAGGINGRQVIDRFLPLVDGLLSPNGVFFLVIVDENKPSEIIAALADRFECKSSKRSAGCEKLYVLRFQRRSMPVYLQ